ncbi:putative lipase/esterase [Actinomycetes bacterium]|nr:putative lipase/esterase [Actinomycetes bacterium]
MTLHHQTKTFLELLASHGEPPLEQMTPVEARAMIRKYYVASEHPIFASRDVNAGGVPARLYLPSDEKNLGLCVFIHGGGWVFGTLDDHDDLCRRLAMLSGHAVLSIDYRLAPEFAFPVPLEDCLAATRWAHENASSLGCDASRMVVCGDSAGGNLSTLVAQHSGVPLKMQLLIYPATDARCITESYRRNALGYLLTAPAMQWFYGHYLSGGKGSADNPLVSPLLASDEVLAKMPPTLVITAEYDPLCDEGENYARKLNSLGVPTTCTRYFGQTDSRVCDPSGFS